jgi:translation initiation factor 5B
VGTPLCIPTKEYIDTGKIASIEINHKQVDVATKGQKVAIKVCTIICSSTILSLTFLGVLFFIFLLCCDQIVANNSDEQQRSFGRHFDMEDELVSHVSRRSIDILKQNYRVSPKSLCYLVVHVQYDR